MKKILCLILTVCMMLQCVNALAFDASTQMTPLMSALEIMKGDENGNFNLDSYVTRAEFSKIAVAASSYRNSVSTVSKTSPFHDVPYTYWGASYIRVASINSLVNGYPDSSFRPEDPVLLEEGVTIALKLLGYTNDDFGLAWPEGQMNLATTLELLDGIHLSVGCWMTRQDVMQLIYNTLSTKMKSGQTKLIDSFGYSITEDVVLIASSNEDVSVANNKVLTSEGTYKIDEGFDKSLIGYKGDLVTKNGDTVVTFFPSNEKSEVYTLNTVMNDSILAYDGSGTKSVDIGENTTIYYKSQKSTLSAVKASASLGDSISVFRNTQGDIEYALIGSSSLKGPFTVLSADLGVYGANDETVYYKDGKKSSKSAISTYDIVYYSKEINAIWAYSKQVTGMYESATPSKDNIEKITVSGIEYGIETAEAYSKLTTGGDCNFGDTVTLLLGRNGEVADIKSASQSSSISGYLVETGTKEYTRDNGDKYSSYYVTIVTAAGSKSTFKVNKDYSDYKSSVINIKLSGDTGTVSKVVSRSQQTGLFNYKTGMLGTAKISSSINILDILNTESSMDPSYYSVFAQNLDGVNIKSGKVLYYTTNTAGEIDSLFLDNVTGDGATYGIVTEIPSKGNAYSLTTDGNLLSYSGTGQYSLETGLAVQIQYQGGRITKLTRLYKIAQSSFSINNDTLSAGGTEYPISANIKVFNHSGSNTWTLGTMSDALNASKSSVKAYYDKDPSVGGKIRVIVVYK